MSRRLYAAFSLVLAAGLISAIVRAQDRSGLWGSSRSGQTAALDSRTAPATAGLAGQFQDIGRIVTAEYQAIDGAAAGPSLTPPINAAAGGQMPILLAANDGEAGEMHSVLRRRQSGPAAPEAPAPAAPTPPPAPEPLTTPSETPAAQDIPAPATASPAAELPGLIVPDTASQAPVSPAPSPLRAPQGGAIGSPSATDASGQSSSRRTFQSGAGTDVSVPHVATRPIAPRRAMPPTAATADSPPSALASTVGALLRVDTIGPETVLVGEQATFQVRVANLGVTDAKGVTVQATVPAGLQVATPEAEDGNARIEQKDAATNLIVWQMDQLPARAERQLTLKVVPQTTEPVDLAVQWTVQPLASAARVVVQQPKLELALRGPREINYGETHVYTVVLSNPGTGEAKNVLLRLALADDTADTLQVGKLAAGVSREFQVEVTARKAGQIQIAAAATADSNLQTQAAEQILVKRAELKIETLGSARKYAGSVGTYQVRVVNAGNAQAENVQASVRLPDGAKYVEGIENAQQTGDRLAWSVGPLAAGEERTYRFFCQLNRQGEAAFAFSLRDAGGLEVASQAVTQVEAIADLKMTIDDPQGAVPVGKEVKYEIEITNRGTAAATGVQVIAQFSDGIEPIAADGVRGEVVPGQVVFQPIATIAPNETVKLTVRAKAHQDGNHLFRAELRSGQPECRLVAEESTVFFGDDLQPLRTAERPAPPAPRVSSPSDAPSIYGPGSAP